MTRRGGLPGGEIISRVFRHLDHGQCRDFQTGFRLASNAVIEFAKLLGVLAAFRHKTAIGHGNQCRFSGALRQ